MGEACLGRESIIHLETGLTIPGCISGCDSFPASTASLAGSRNGSDNPCPLLHFHPHSDICPDRRALFSALVGLVFFMG